MIAQEVVDVIVRVGAMASAVFALGFVIRYTQKYRWWRTDIGRHMMSFMGGCTLILCLSVLALFFPDLNFRQEIRAACWIILPVIFGWRLLVLERASRYDEHGNFKKKTE